MATLTHLERLEAESIDIMREAIAESGHPAMLYSIGKGSSVMVHLALKAFHPSKPPFPLLHVDAAWRFREAIEFRDATTRRTGLDLIVHTDPEAVAQDIAPFTHRSALPTDAWETQGLAQALDQYGFDVVFCGARRDEDRSGAGERIFSFRSAEHRRDPKMQRPELWRLYNARKNKGDSFRVFPLSNWTELDLWLYIRQESIPIAPLYFAKRRPVVLRDGALIVVDDDRRAQESGEVPMQKDVRFRTLGGYPRTGAVESRAETVNGIIEEMSVASTSEREGRTPLRFIICGSVGDGKSTLIGRLLHESKAFGEDQRTALVSGPKKLGAQDDDPELAVRRDGPTAEREQGTAAGVAYRFFSTDKRNFIVADTPGLEAHTRDMVTGASTADAAVILIDAFKGMSTQTRRHSYLVSLLGIRSVVVAVNKLDSVNYSREVFDSIERDYRAFAEKIGLTEIVCIPVSAQKGDNITVPSDRMPWYRGPALMGYLESVVVADDCRDRPFRMPVQWVNRAHPDFRGFSGRVVGGSVRPGDRVRVLPSGKEVTVTRIVTRDGDLERAVAGQSVTLALDTAIDVSRGDLFADSGSPAGIADQFEASIIWMGDDEMLPGRPYLLKIGAKTVGVTMAAPKYKVNVNTLEHLAAKTLQLNEIGVCNLNLDQPIAFDAYAENRDTGGFIVIDRMTNGTIGAGFLHFALRRSQNIHWQAIEVNKDAHGALKGHRPCVVWFTGLSGAGKSVIANLVEKRLHALGRHTYLLDGDNVRHGLNKDLGFTEGDRVENIRRVAEVARLMVDAGLIVLVAFISPFRAERIMARGLVSAGEFCEVFVDTPLAVAEARDTKGLYKKARRGELKNFTGIDSPYEPPEQPEVRLDTTSVPADIAAEQIVERLREMGVLDLR